MALENSLNKKKGPLEAVPRHFDDKEYTGINTHFDEPEERPNTIRNIVFAVFLMLVTLYWVNSNNFFGAGTLTEKVNTSEMRTTSGSAIINTNEVPVKISDSNPFKTNGDIIERMGHLMYELGYTNVDRAILEDLRKYGVTATKTSQFHDVGYNKLTLEELKVLGNANVTPTFAGMMKELGYNLTVEEMILLKKNNITANNTSKLMDMGLKDMSVDDLVRLGRYNINQNVVRNYMRQNDGKVPTVDELVRYRISNQ